MKLSNGQKEYLLELLSREYFLPAEYCPEVKAAIKGFSTHRYSEEELEFLAGMPQSLTADLYLNHSSFKNFAKRFMLWLDVLAYNINDDSAQTIAYLPNPDPSSSQKLLRIFYKGEQIQIAAVPPSQFKAQKTAQPIAPLAYLGDYQQINALLAEFLAIARQTPNEAAIKQEDYLNSLASKLNRTKEMRLSWLELREKAQSLEQTNADYTFCQRSLGLITPSTLEFINLINARNKTARQKRVAPAMTNPFAPEIRLLQKLRKNFKAPAPLNFAPKNNSMKAFKLPPLPFMNQLPPLKPNMRIFNCPQMSKNNCPRAQEKVDSGMNHSPEEQISAEKKISPIEFTEPQA